MPGPEGVARHLRIADTESDLDRCIETATSALLRQQRQDGHWVFELEADATISAEYVALQHFLGQFDTALEAKIANYLRRLQAPHGGWSLYHGGDARRLPGAAHIGLVCQRHATIPRSPGLATNDVGISTDAAFLSRLAVVGCCTAGDCRFVSCIYPRIGLSVHAWQRRRVERTCTLSPTRTMTPATFRRSEHS